MTHACTHTQVCTHIFVVTVIPTWPYPPAPTHFWMWKGDFWMCIVESLRGTTYFKILNLKTQTYLLRARMNPNEILWGAVHSTVTGRTDRSGGNGHVFHTHVNVSPRTASGITYQTENAIDVWFSAWKGERNLSTCIWELTRCHQISVTLWYKDRWETKNGKLGTAHSGQGRLCATDTSYICVRISPAPKIHAF